jgi:hypothetical protein
VTSPPLGGLTLFRIHAGKRLTTSCSMPLMFCTAKRACSLSDDHVITRKPATIDSNPTLTTTAASHCGQPC